MDDKQPSRGAILLARDLVAELRDCGKPTNADDWAHKGIILSHQLAGVCRYSLRQDPVQAADAVWAHRWQCGLLDCVAAHPQDRGPALAALVELAELGRAPREGTL